ncbi:MAG: hypothetical protein KGJ07_00055 [Patescibacteria group bacterium]|nr:hypothetical protein [Patescibacteria group bacterium]
MTETNDVIATQMNQLYALTGIQSMLQAIYNNLALISEGGAGQVITVNNISLFYLAAKYYGDATEWTTIAEANGLYDPMIIDTIQLTIPSAAAANTGGILSI